MLNSLSMTRCENSHSHVLKKREIKFRINLKALEETLMSENKENILRILCEFLFSIVLLRFPFQCYSFKYHFNAGFNSVFLRYFAFFIVYSLELTSLYEESGSHFTLSISGIGKGISSFIYICVIFYF